MNGLLARARSFWRGFRRPTQTSAEMDEEMRFHIEMEAERLIRERGMEPDEARRQAAIAFGGVEKRKEEGREVRGLTWVSGLSLDLKLAWRMLLKSPGLTVVGVLGIALGIAIGVGSFIALSTFFYPRLPLEDGDRIVALENWDIEANNEARRSLHDFVTWREEMRSVEQIAAVATGYRGLVTGVEPMGGARVAEMTAAGFQVARVPPLLGRYIVEEDERAAAPSVAVIGYDLWQSHFEGDPEVIGRSIMVGDSEHILVGVMPPGFAFPKNQQLWTALRADPSLLARGEGPQLFVFGRLAPGTTNQQAQAELTALGRRAAVAFPETNAHLRPRVLPYTYPLDGIRGARLWAAARLQLMANLLLIAIAVNIAVLVYARTAMRQGEIAVRTALGASRRRIVAQLFVEALVLSILGGELGLATVYVGLRRVKLIMEGRDFAGFWVDYALEPRYVLYALGLAIVAAVIVGVVPGLRSTGRKLNADLRRVGNGATRRLGPVWTSLIVAQVAVAVAVLPTALQIGFGEIRQMAVRPTFPAHEFLQAGLGIAVPFRPGMDADSYYRETTSRFTDRLGELERRLEAEPAVAGVTVEGWLPGREYLMEVEGVPGREGPGLHSVRSTGVAADYFELLDARVLAGRALQPSDFDEGGTAVLVNESFVRRVLGSEPAIGRRLRYVPPPELGQSREEVVPGPWLEIVGIVQDLHVGTLDPDVARALTYYPLTTGQLQSAALMVRIRGGDTDGFAPQIRRIAAALDPDLRIGSVENLGAGLRPSNVTTIITVLVLVMGTVVLLSAAGIHALMSLTVTRARKEIGIRTALGARPGRLLARIFARAGAQLGIGAFAGAALGAALLASSGMSDGAAIAVGVVVAVMWTAGVIAAAGPARRGLSVQPMEALREE